MVVPLTIPDYTDIRKTYVRARSGYGSVALGMIDKSAAHAEFNAFVQQERDKAAQEARTAALKEGWHEGSFHVYTLMGGDIYSTEHQPIDDNPYEEK